MNEQWDFRFLELASHIAQWSKDPSTRVGAVIVRPNRTIASVGYNGLPRGVFDDPSRLKDRSVKLSMTIHAEMNALLNAQEPLTGYTLYCTMAPCSNCAASIIQSGITRVVFPKPSSNDRWNESWKLAQQMYLEAQISVVKLQLNKSTVSDHPTCPFR